MSLAPVATVMVVVLLALPHGLGLRRRSRPIVATTRRNAPWIGRSARWLRLPLRDRRPAGSPWIASLEAMARATATGSSLHVAVADAADDPGAPDVLTEIARSQRGGRSVATALDAARPAADPDEVLALGVLRAVARAGGPAAEPLDRAAGVLRERRVAREERSVAAAQAQLSARVLSALPGVVVLWAVATDPDLARVLLRTPAGLVCLLVGGALNLAGWWWMRRIVSSA